MRKLISLFLMWAFVICGCSAIQLNPVEQDLAASIVARRLGYTIAEKYPDTARDVASLAGAILIYENEEIVQNLALEVREIILSEISDPILRSDISALMEMITITGDVEQRYQTELIRAAARGLLMGVNNE